MASGSCPGRSSEEIVDTTPFLGSGDSPSSSSDGNAANRHSVQRQGLRQAARLLRQASSRRVMREPSMRVRETAAEQLEERQSDWAHSKPVVVLDVLWNFAFVVAAAAVLISSRGESPEMPLRLWIVGYAFQCVLHVACVCVEYRRRRRRQSRIGGGPEGNDESLSRNDDENNSVAKHLESANTMFSFIWWIVGFYWVSAGGQSLANASPQLYWLCVIFLGFDVFFVVFCVALACVIGIAVCCCLPCIIGLLYAVADQEGASKKDVDDLPKFKFKKAENSEKISGDAQGPFGGTMAECGTDSPMEQVLTQEDAECCICLSAYDDGAELRQLPCGHHFHCSCVDKWLFINATCPLCKYNILMKSTTCEV